MDAERCSAMYTYAVSVRAVKAGETSTWTDEIECWLRSLGSFRDELKHAKQYLFQCCF